jgi:hypothetical protein
MIQPLTEFRHNGGPPLDDDKASSGWIKIYRDIREHPVVGFGQPVKPNDPTRGAYSRGEAFQDLLMEAQYQPGSTRINGQSVTLEIGQLVAARSYLAIRWNWSEQTVRTFLAHLVKAGIIVINQLSVQRPGASKKTAANAITLCNYEKYQAYSEAVTAYVASLKAPDIQPAKYETDQPANNQLTTSQQPAGNQLATSQQPANNQNLSEREARAPAHAHAHTREGEELHPHGVIVNCETIRHPNFTISLSAIEMNTVAANLSKNEIKTRCLAHAMQWAAEIESGRNHHTVVPNKIANFLSASIMGEVNRGKVAEVKAARVPSGRRTGGETPEERKAREMRELDQIS